VKIVQILIIRHGESEEDTVNVHEPLTSRGIEQGKKMSMRVSEEFPPEFIWSSTLQRASKTAEILGDTVGCPVKYLDELREQNDDESNLQFRLRAEHILSYIKANSKQYKRIAIISHGGMITRLIESFLELPADKDAWFNTDNTGIHFLEYHPKAHLVRFTNSTSHLE
jgi:2,3-bisphosphoglycerate-dependent phosphoglycerate mutase